MSKKQDIIGLVKEWKASACGGTPVMDCNRCELIKQQFPLIADVLIQLSDEVDKLAYVYDVQDADSSMFFGLVHKLKELSAAAHSIQTHE